MAENVIITLVDRVDILTKEIQKVQVQTAKPPIVDTSRMASEVTRNLSSYSAAGEASARRIEAAVARIPDMIPKKQGIEVHPRWIILGIVLVMALTGLAGYMLAPDVPQGLINQQARTIEYQKEELNYFREKAPKTAAQFDREFRQP